MVEIEHLTWFHTIDLPDGSSTPGLFDPRPISRRLRWPVGLRGGRCLDVGTCDGFWAFEMERLGAASVLAIDVDDPLELDRRPDMQPLDPATAATWEARRGRTFEIARRALGSRAVRQSCSVYDLDPIVHGYFDVVFCGTLLIHLRDPIRALGAIRRVCTGELLLAESIDPILDLFARPLPCARIAPGSNQWWHVNAAGLRRTVEVAGFDVVWTGRRYVTPIQVEGTRSPGHLGLRLTGRRLLNGALQRRPFDPFLATAAGLERGAIEVALGARPREQAWIEP